jgi:hypothetical protein
MILTVDKMVQQAPYQIELNHWGKPNGSYILKIYILFTVSYLSWRWRCEFESRSCRCILDTTLCQWLSTGRWVSSGTHVSSTNKNDHHDTTEIFLKVALNTNTLTLTLSWIQNAKYIINSISFSGSPYAYIHTWTNNKIKHAIHCSRQTLSFFYRRFYSIHHILKKLIISALAMLYGGWGCRLLWSLSTVIAI